MEHGTSLTSLMIVVSVAFLIPVLLHRFHLRFLPVVVAEIIIGIVIGKSGLQLVSEDPYLELLSSLGFIYLMFLSGLELDFSILTSKKKNALGEMNAVKTGLAVCGAVLLLSVLMAFGLDAAGFITEPFLFTIVISTISLGVVVPILKEKRLMDTRLGQTMLFITVVLDFVTMIMLAFYVSLHSQNLNNMFNLLLFFVIAFFIYRILRRFPKKRKWSDSIKSGTIQIGTRAVFALILLFVVLSQTLGVEAILGAFLAGVIVSLMGLNKEFVHKLETFGYGFLIPIFFVMVGADLELGALLGDPSILVLLPVLLLCFYISKMMPSLLFRKWFTWRETLGAGLLLSSNLSLVVAAAEVALKFGIITAQMRGALILVAVLSCFISPILFSRIFPKMEPRRMKIGIVGANHVTLPVSLDLEREGYDVELYSAQPPEDVAKEPKHSRFPLREVKDLTETSLRDAGLFDKDVVVLGTADDEVNLGLAVLANETGVDRVIVRVENPDRLESGMPDRVQLLSSLYATRTLLKAVIEHPSAVKLITQHDDSIQEAELRNPEFDGTLLRNLSFLGNVLVMRIFRGDSFLVPHGNTELKLGDRLLISGDADGIAAVKRELE